MIHLDEDALICDLAQTYHIFDYRGLSPSLVAVLCYGLEYDSRIKKKIEGRTLNISDFLLAALVDRASLLVWSKTKDASNGTNKPKSMLEILEPGIKSNQTGEYKTFDDYSEYERKRAELMRG